MANTLEIVRFYGAQRNGQANRREKAVPPGRFFDGIVGFIPALLISITGGPSTSQATSIPLPRSSLAGCLAIPDAASRKLCLDNQALIKLTQAAKASVRMSAPLSPPPDRALDTSFCRGDGECIKGSYELQTAGDCVDLKTSRNLGHGSESLAQAIPHECLSEYLRKFHPETSLAQVQKLEREAPNGILADIPGKHVGIGYAEKSGFLTLRAQANFDCRAEHPGGAKTVCNAPFDKAYMEEDWPYWRDERGKSRVAFDRIWAEELRKSVYRRRWLQQLAATSEGSPTTAGTTTPSAATQSDDLSIPDFDVDNNCAKAYGNTQIQGIGRQQSGVFFRCSPVTMP